MTSSVLDSPANKVHTIPYHLLMLASFFYALLLTLDFFSIHKTEKQNECGQYLAIFSSRLVNNGVMQCATEPMFKGEIMRDSF